MARWKRWVGDPGSTIGPMRRVSWQQETQGPGREIVTLEVNQRVLSVFQATSPLFQGPCHTKSTTVIVNHYSGSKTLRR